jgi:hypothetical protein
VSEESVLVQQLQMRTLQMESVLGQLQMGSAMALWMATAKAGERKKVN